MAHSILIVDDEANQRFMLEQALRTLTDDCTVTTVASGQEALDRLDLYPPDLIITDYNMPVMNGLELIARVRASSHLCVRIILITAYGSPDLNAALQQLSVDHYLMKPVPLALLRSAATDALKI